TDDAVENQFSLALERLAQIVVEVRIHEEVGIPVLQFPQVKPLPGEVCYQRLRSLILQHAADLLLQNGWIFQLALFRDGQNLVIGNAAPNEEGQPRCQFQIADSMNGSGGEIRGIAFEPENELRIGKHPAKRHLDSFIEIARLASFAIEA